MATPGVCVCVCVRTRARLSACAHHSWFVGVDVADLRHSSTVQAHICRSPACTAVPCVHACVHVHMYTHALRSCTMRRSWRVVGASNVGGLCFHYFCAAWQAYPLPAAWLHSQLTGCSVAWLACWRQWGLHSLLAVGAGITATGRDRDIHLLDFLTIVGHGLGNLLLHIGIDRISHLRREGQRVGMVP